MKKNFIISLSWFKELVSSMQNFHRKSSFIISFLLLLISSCAYAQVPSIAWSYKSDNDMLNEDYPVDMVIRNDGFIITASGIDGINAYNGNGKFISQYFKGARRINRILSCPGGYYVIGNSSLSEEFDGWLAKLNEDFEVIWEKTYGGNALDELASVTMTEDGGLILGGTTASCTGDLAGINTDDWGVFRYCWLVKTDSIGNLEWTKIYGNYRAGQSICKVVQLENGDYIFAGSVSPGEEIRDAPNLLGNADYWIVRTNNIGEIIWQKTYGGTGDEGARDAIITPAGDLLITGWSKSKGGDVPSPFSDKFTSMFYLKVSTDNGKKIWSKAIGVNSFDMACTFTPGAHLAIGQDGNILAGATLLNDFSALNISAGTQSWKGKEDYWILNIDESNGNVIWHKNLGSINLDRCSTIELDKSGRLIVAGGSNSIDGDITTPDPPPSFYRPWIVALNPCPYYISLNDTICNGESYFFMGSEYSASGQYEKVYTTAYGCDSTLVLNLTVEGSNPEIAVQDDTISTTTPGSAYQWLKDGEIIPDANLSYYIPTETGDYQVVVITAGNCSDTSSSVSYKAPNTNLPAKALTIYPNPARDKISIEWDKMLNGASISLIGIDGRIFKNIKVHESKVTLPLSGLSSSVYLIKITINDSTEVQKFTKL